MVTRWILGYLLPRLSFGVDRSLSLVEHLEELRRRLMYAVLGLALGTVVGFWQQDRILQLLLRPAGLTQLLALTVLEPLLVEFRLAFTFGLVLSFPWILLQTLIFVAPALTEREGRYVVPISALSLVLGVAGVIFGYNFVLPTSTRWLLAQAGTVMTVQITALSYVSYATWFLAALALGFQTPLVVLALVGIGAVTVGRMRREWRSIYMGIAVLAAVITPDWSPVSMLLVAGAMVALYELSLVLARFVFPKRG